MSENGLSIHIKKAEGHELSVRTASALEELAASVVQDLEQEVEEAEVSGFRALNVGPGLGAIISGPSPQEVCIGWYSASSGGSEDADGGSKGRDRESCYGIFY